MPPSGSRMLTELRIAGLGVIGDATIELGPGFTAVTGETGAGKTMVVTGLSLLLGSKADQSLIRRGAERALIEGRWRVGDGDAGDRVVVLGGELDGEDVLVARQLTPTRSRAFVGGAAVPVGAAAALVGGWVTIHGQAEQMRLSTPDRQREVLDAFAGPELTEVLARHTADHRARQAAAAELKELTSQARERARELDLLTFGLDEIARVDPQPGEDEALAAEAQRLQAADDLRAAARTTLVALAGDDESFEEGTSALSMLATARKALAPSARVDPVLTELATRLADAGYAVADVASALSSYLDDLDADPARLEWIAGRRAELQSLTRKYGATVDDVLAWAAQAATRATSLGSSDVRIVELQDLVAGLDLQLGESSARLTTLRRAAADRLSRLAQAELAALAMPHARIGFHVTALPAVGPNGADQVSLLFSANPGTAVGPLGRVASGGELSRVRLALEVVLAEQDSGHTFVFDEVDAGVGGSVALEIGRRLARLARTAQVIVVTHLAQVAAFADRHFVVEKSDDGQVTTSSLHEVAAQDRLAELARMMAGLESTSAALAHAADLLRAVQA